MATVDTYRDNDEPRLGGGLVLSFLAVVVATALAFLALDDKFTGSAEAARMYVPQTRVAQAQPVGKLTPPAAIAEVANQSTAIDKVGIDRGETASIASDSAASLSCNVSACARSYRSFRSSDCTFQPFEGPRRQCTR